MPSDIPYGPRPAFPNYPPEPLYNEYERDFRENYIKRFRAEYANEPALPALSSDPVARRIEMDQIRLNEMHHKILYLENQLKRMEQTNADIKYCNEEFYEENKKLREENKELQELKKHFERFEILDL